MLRRLSAVAAIATSVLAVALIGPATADAGRKPAPVPSSIPEYGAKPGDAGSLAGRRTFAVQPSGVGGPTARADYTYDMPAGGHLTDFVGISNYSRVPLTLMTYAADAFNTADGGFDLLATGKRSADVGAWITMKSTSVTIPPRTRADVPFTLRIPGNASPGDHVGGIVAAYRTQTTDATGAPVALDQRVAARIYLRIQGELKPRLDVVRLKTRYTTRSPLAGDVTLDYVVRNTGNVRLAASQDVVVGVPMLGTRRARSVDRIEELLPGQQLAVHAVVRGVPPLVLLSPKVTLHPSSTVGGRALVVAPATASTRLFVMPWLLLVIAGGVVALRAWLHRRRRKPRGGGGKHRKTSGRGPGGGPRRAADPPSPNSLIGVGAGHPDAAEIASTAGTS